MEPKPDQTTAEPVNVQTVTSAPSAPIAEQASKTETLSAGQTVSTPAATAPPQATPVLQKSTAMPAKKPVPAIILSVLVFAGLAAVAYYAYSKSK